MVERGKREIAAHPYTPPIQKEIVPVSGAELLLEEQHGLGRGGGPEHSDAKSPSPVAEAFSGELAEIAAVGTDLDQHSKIGQAPASAAPIDPLPVHVALGDPAREDAAFGASLLCVAAANRDGTTTLSPEMALDSATPSASASDQEDLPSASTPPPDPPLQAGAPDPSLASSIPDASRLSLEETYLRERAAARLRAREAELRLEAEMAARRAEQEEREAREAREQLLVERGRRPYAVEGSIRDTV